MPSQPESLRVAPQMLDIVRNQERNGASMRIIFYSTDARTEEEENKIVESITQIVTRGYQGVTLRWQGDQDHRAMVCTINPYSASTVPAIFLNKVPTEEELAEHHLAVDEEGDIDAESNMVQCEECGKKYCVSKCIFPEDNGDAAYCQSCARETLAQCSRCDAWYESSEDFDEVYRDYDECVGYWCPECIEEQGAQWDEADERMYLRRPQRMQEYLNPQGVLANPAQSCPECGESERGYCERHLRQCIQEMEQEATTLWVYDTKRRAYHESMHNRFKSLKLRTSKEHPRLYYGIELEVLWDSRKANYDKLTKEFIEATNGMFVAEYDRSVDDKGAQLGGYIGAEFISRPTSYKRWTSPEHVALLKAGMEVLKKYGTLVPQDKDCGLHVHMSKAFFERKTTKNVAEIKRDIDWFFQYFQDEIEKISRREYTQYCASKAFRIKNTTTENRRANTMFGIKGKFQLEPSSITVSQGSGPTHHDCIIETNKTIEARTFRSTTDVNELLATIEFCRSLAHAARNRTGLIGKTFGDIMFTKESPHLLEYIHKIKLDTSRKLKNKLEVNL